MQFFLNTLIVIACAPPQKNSNPKEQLLQNTINVHAYRRGSQYIRHRRLNRNIHICHSRIHVCVFESDCLCILHTQLTRNRHTPVTYLLVFVFPVRAVHASAKSGATAKFAFTHSNKFFVAIRLLYGGLVAKRKCGVVRLSEQRFWNTFVEINEIQYPTPVSMGQVVHDGL